MKGLDVFEALNISQRCRELRVSLWQCPHFLFIVMGFIIALAILTTHLVAARYAEPEVSLAIVFGVTIALFIVAHLVVGAFEHVAEAARLKSEFISIISHELRTPLSTIKWELNVLAGLKEPVGSDKHQEALGIISASNERMITLINNLLDVNRIDDQNLILKPMAFSLTELTGKLIKEYSVYARASNLKLILLPSQDFKVRSDETRIKSVISRFLDNAVRYSAGPGTITVALEDLGDFVQWSIADEGVGVPAAQVERIFSKFFRASNILRYQTEGLGIGLFVSRYIIEASGGKIGFRSIEGHGSTFFFTLPKV